jgi:large subunit ribosomal protein L14
MIQTETRLDVLDNSGALQVKCFKVFGKKFADIGTMVVVSVQTYRAGKKVKKGEVFKGIIVQTKFAYRRQTGFKLNFDKNGVILWKRKEDSPVGTRIRGTVPIELRFKGLLKVVMLSSSNI